jgi:nucleoside-diphosphate-sugar epimerase
MIKISILGCGWLGLPLAEALAKDGYQVKGSTTHVSKISLIRALGIQPFIVNLDPEFKGEGHFLDSELAIINLPPKELPNEKNFHETQLKSVLSKIKKSSVDKVIFISSTAVYPSNDTLVSEEDATYESLSRSGISLLAMEDIFRNEPELKSTIVRFGGLYGPNRHPGRFLMGKSDLPGGKNPVNMIHLEDCIGVIKHIINKNIWGQTFNACSPNHPTRAAFYTEAAASFGVDPPTFSAAKSPYKIVSSEYLTQSGYEFVH